jgi:hypothetical protein
MVQAPRSAAMPNRVFLGARGPAAKGKPDQSIGGTRLGRRVVEPGRRLIIKGVAVRRLFRITDRTQIASDWLLEWHAGVALVVLPGDCVVAPGCCSSNPKAWCERSECAMNSDSGEEPGRTKGGALERIGRGGTRYRRQVAAPSSWRGVSFCASGNMRPRQDAGLCVNEHNECLPYRPADPGRSFEVAHGFARCVR